MTSPDEVAPNVKPLRRYSGRPNPLFLTTAQTYQLFAVLFGCNVALLIALVNGAAKNSEVLESIKASARQAWEAERQQVLEDIVVSKFGHVREYSKPAPEPGRAPEEKSLGISVPEGWQFRGCRMQDPRSVEILLATP